MQLALTKYVHVYVVDRLAPQVIAVHDDAKAFLATLLFGETLCGEQYVASERLIVLFAQVMEGRNVLLRNDKKMHRRLRGDVVEGDYLVIFVNLLRGDIPGHDLAEQTIHGITPGLER